jgi:hypothetical protein
LGIFEDCGVKPPQSEDCGVKPLQRKAVTGHRNPKR